MFQKDVVLPLSFLVSCKGRKQLGLACCQGSKHTLDYEGETKTISYGSLYSVLSERGFDPRTCGLWAHHASAAPLWLASNIINKGMITLILKSRDHSLILKSRDHSKLRNWRPITLFGSIYEWYGKNYCAKPSWDEEEMDGQKLAIQCNSYTKSCEIHLLSDRKTHQCLGLFSPFAMFCTPCMSWPLSHMFLHFVTWAKRKSWKWSC